MCMDLISLARMEGLKVGLIPGRAIKEALMYICLFSVFPRASCSLGQWSITQAVRGWDDEVFVCYSRERADLHYSAYMCAAKATFTHTFQL